jgi:hypothetical protein
MRDSKTMLRPTSVVDNVGLTSGQQTAIVRVVREGLTGGELEFRQGLMSHLLQGRLEPEQRRIVFQRGLNYFRGQVTKSLVLKAAGDDDDGDPETTDTEEELKRKINRRIKRSGKGGLRLEYLNDLIAEHGALRIAHTLRDMATRIRFAAGRLWLDDPTTTAHQGAKRGLHRSMEGTPVALLLRKAEPEAGPVAGRYVIRAPESAPPRLVCRDTKK